MVYFRLLGQFMRASVQEETAYQANFWITLLYSLLNLATGVAGVLVLFGQVESVRGWTLGDTLALLGVYLIVGALRGLCFGPSLEALAGMDGDVWSGRLDFTLLRPVNIQFLASFRKWRLFEGFNLLLGLAVLAAAMPQLSGSLSLGRMAAFLAALAAGVILLYALLLAFTALVFWSPGVLFTWVFDGVFQMARYPLALYPGWLRLILTWIIPVGVITTFPAEALTGALTSRALAAGLILAVLLLVLASLFFRQAIYRYSSASS